MNRAVLTLLCMCVLAPWVRTMSVTKDRFTDMQTVADGGEGGLAKLLELLATSTSAKAEEADESSDEESVVITDKVSDEIIKALAEDIDLNLEDIVKGCSHGKCSFCTKGKFLKVCVNAGLVKLGFQLSVTVNGHTVYRKVVSIRNPPPFCVNNVPFLKHVANFCIQIYNVDLAKKSACVKVTFKVFGKKISLKVGCFKIPHAMLEGMDTADVSVDQGSALMFTPYQKNN
ncbi:hypothetical protein MAR_017688 [Mya arenaria]|uniref:DUF4773 domain-containing protein n=1 Tax=Mya arenaria TaxID=6604 RepID=A0ABY7ECJ0_MYAAR|nr:uncharacterized protein LOC128237009 [Mya arenaria]WAR07730.1 hypothetical protein MAR_017688 [Mya arenaria]